MAPALRVQQDRCIRAVAQANREAGVVNEDVAGAGWKSGGRSAVEGQLEVPGSADT